MDMGLAFVMKLLFILPSMVLATMFFISQAAKRRTKLPPGSLGWPLLGETLKLFTQNPNLFLSTRQQRYGDIFKTHILGCPCVVLASPEAARFVLVTEAGLFKPTYPRCKEQLIGPWAVFYHQGGYHARMRKLVQAAVSLDIIRTMVPQIQALAVSALDSLCGGRVVNFFYGMKKFTFDVAVLSIFGRLDDRHKDKLEKNYYALDKGYNSFPINLPGTPYRQSALARRRLEEILGEILEERKEKKWKQNVLLDNLLKFRTDKDEEAAGGFTDDQIVDNIIGVLFAAQDTTASVLTWMLKYIQDDPKLLADIKGEQMAIYEENDKGKQPLGWAQTRRMPITSKAISESLRLASIVSYTYREAVEDVEYQGYLIPKGWKVLPAFRCIHHNPDFFDDPLSFNLSRFDRGLKPNTFLPFGNGAHACPGNELAKMEIFVLIYHLVNEFRWEVVKSKRSDKVQYNPFPIPWKGLPAKFWRAKSNNQVAARIEQPNQRH
ncbi:abscisic acid 8'-hydroxylase 4-like [Malania oleifera]|uniref:abscisic acid 8'-hydroxylase 4-like n=1 Tax=Malania oleifera TaxID=397392 RepID=UPI0025AEAF3E|nr:abscisic acid 8'-hydroxylase 4-like [Malania oleifera]